MRLRRARRAAAFMRSASFTVIAIGFSHNTCSPRFEGGDGHRRVQVVGQGDADPVEGLGIEHLFRVVVGALHAELGRHLRQALGVLVAEGRRDPPGHGSGSRMGVLLPVAQADDGHSHVALASCHQGSSTSTTARASGDRRRTVSGLSHFR